MNLADSSIYKDLRPTTDKNRQALFNILESAKFLNKNGIDLEDCNVLDLCCGTGALAFEAISRFANHAVLVDCNRFHIGVAKKNSELLGVDNCTKFIIADANYVSIPEAIFDLIFIDPPYKIDATNIVKNILRKKYAHEKTLIILESSNDINFDDFLTKIDSRKYGNTYFNFFILK